MANIFKQTLIKANSANEIDMLKFHRVWPNIWTSTHDPDDTTLEWKASLKTDYAPDLKSS